MRQLTKKQKEYLMKAFVKDSGITGYDDLLPQQQEELRAMNDTEILWQEADRFLSDLYFKRTYS